MNAYLLPGVMGLLIGLLLHWAGFSRGNNLRLALGLRRSYALRSGLTAVGWAMALTALLCWLAVIDVDTIEVLPLSLGTILGGAILGIAAGLCGFTPMTAFAGLGGSPAGHAGNALEALSVLAGCFTGALLLGSSTLDNLFAPLRTASPYAAATFFKITLDEPFLLSGGFLGQACAGFIPVVIALCIPSPRPVILPVAEPVPAEPSGLESAPESTAPESTEPEPESSPAPEEAPEETFVALLEGEEPLVVDTELDEEDEDLPAIDTEQNEEEEPTN